MLLYFAYELAAVDNVYNFLIQIVALFFFVCWLTGSRESLQSAPSTPMMKSTVGSNTLRSPAHWSANQCSFPKIRWVKFLTCQKWIRKKSGIVTVCLYLCDVHSGFGPACGAHPLLQPPRGRRALLHRYNPWYCRVFGLLCSCWVCLSHRQT